MCSPSLHRRRGLIAFMTNPLTHDIPPTARSVLRQLEDLLPQIEEGLTRGYSHAAMHASLSKLGINITLAYYHRSLRILRQERKSTGEPFGITSVAPAIVSKTQLKVTTPSNMKADDLPNALTEQASDSKADITAERTPPRPFRWKGADLLNKDWSQF